MNAKLKPTQAEIEAAAAVIANARGGRRGMPEMTNVLEMLQVVSSTLYREVMEDAEMVLSAISVEAQRQRDELSVEMESCHRLLDAHWGYAADTVALDTLEDRIKLLIKEAASKQPE